MGVTVKTIAQWINDGNWERYKRNLVLTRNEQMALLLEELEELNNVIQNKEEGKRYADYKESNIRRNLIKDIKELETKASISEAINALTGFWILCELRIWTSQKRFRIGWICSLNTN